MPINAHPEYLAAESEYLKAQTTEEKIKCLKKMIALAPKHKGSENLLKQLKTRLKKLKEKEKAEKTRKKSSHKGIKKESMQAVIIGKTNSGKSTLLSQLTNAKTLISPIKFTTTFPVVGMMPYAGTNIQLIENPAIESEYYDKGLTHTTDTVLILVKNLNEIEEIQKTLNTNAKQIIIFNKFLPFNEDERKIKETLSSKRYNYVIISTSNKENYDELKNKIFKSFNKIRIYTKPAKSLEEAYNSKPLILNPNSTVKDAAEKILKGFSKKIKETKIWGPSSKFPGQKVGLKHELKDLDVIEFKTK